MPRARRSAGTDFSSFNKKLFCFFADRTLIQLERLLIKKNRYSSLINATLNYNTMMSAVLIKYWLGYKKTPRCSKSRYRQICANRFARRFGVSPGSRTSQISVGIQFHAGGKKKKRQKKSKKNKRKGKKKSIPAPCCLDRLSSLPP